jgi:hypothetical protein
VGGGRAPIVGSRISTPSCELDDSQLGDEAVKHGSLEATALEAVTRQPVKTQQTEKT